MNFILNCMSQVKLWSPKAADKQARNIQTQTAFILKTRWVCSALFAEVKKYCTSFQQEHSFSKRDVLIPLPYIQGQVLWLMVLKYPAAGTKTNSKCRHQTRRQEETYSISCDLELLIAIWKRRCVFLKQIKSAMSFSTVLAQKSARVLNDDLSHLK